MVYDVLDVARYVINYSNAQGYGVSNLRLQKLLYYIQAWFLMHKDMPCFSAKIEAWDCGPMVPEVYHEYSIYGGLDIMPVKNSEDIIQTKDKQYINKVIDVLAPYSTPYLVSITQMQTPWLNAYSRNYTNEITTAAIADFFKD